jgi:hypothetical protein
MEKVTVASIHVRKYRYLLKSKKIIFKVLIKLSVQKKKTTDRKNVPVGAGAGAVIRIYSSAEPEPKKYLQLCKTDQRY